MKELLKLESIDNTQNTSFIPHFTIVKNNHNPMPHITLKIKRVKMHWGWDITRQNYADCQLWISKNPDNLKLNTDKINFYCEKLFRLLGTMLPENVYNDIHKFTIENYLSIPKLVFELYFFALIAAKQIFGIK